MKLIGFAHALPKAGVLTMKAACHVEEGCQIMVEGVSGVHTVDSLQVEYENRRQISRGTNFALMSSTLNVNQVGHNKPVFLVEEGDIQAILRQA